MFVHAMQAGQAGQAEGPVACRVGARQPAGQTGQAGPALQVEAPVL